MGFFRTSHQIVIGCFLPAQTFPLRNLGNVEDALLDLAEQQRFVVRWIQGGVRRQRELETRVDAVEARLDAIEAERQDD